jgi:hypothetical protein
VDDVEVVVISLVVVAPDVVVVSSRQPHQPGVLHVSVRVRVFDVEEVVVFIGSELLLSKYFQRAQSVHSGVAMHSGTVSYFLMISSITLLIRWVPTPTLQPLSPTTSYTHSNPAWQAVSIA